MFNKNVVQQTIIMHFMFKYLTLRTLIDQKINQLDEIKSGRMNKKQQIRSSESTRRDSVE